VAARFLVGKTEYDLVNNRWIVTMHDPLPPNTEVATLIHELAHVLHGRLVGPNRSHASLYTTEFMSSAVISRNDTKYHSIGFIVDCLSGQDW
jgi:hypothetical protein